MPLQDVFHYSTDRTSTLVIWLSVLAIVAVLLKIRFRAGIRNVPGPFTASFLPLDRLRTAASGHQFQAHIDYHRKYGTLVRVGPSHVSFSDADWITQVYGISTKYEKSDFYKPFDAKTPIGNSPTVFSIRTEAGHRALKRPVANAYSMSTMVELEPMTNICIKILQRKLDSKQGQAIDLGEWLHWYAFDVITSITFSNRMDFMEKERDIDNIIDVIEGRLAYNAVVGQTPYLHNFLLGNSVVSYLANFIPQIARMNSARYIVDFAAKQLQRYQSKDKSVDDLQDMLARFKRFKDGDQVMSDKALLTHATSNVFAGSDTTAISLRSLFYYLCKNPRCRDKLFREIQESTNLSDPVTFAEANTLDYFKACIKEAMRLHPAVGQLLERLVPPGGATFGETWLPEGTVIGVNPWVVARDRSVYGEDADEYRPERWLEADEDGLKLMERNFLAFGAGSRTCLGKNISLLEMFKVVPQLLRDYDVELDDPDKEWTLRGYWFVKQTGLMCRITRRQTV